MSWSKVRLGDIADFSNGVNFNKAAYSEGIKLISVSNFGNHFYPNYKELSEIKEDAVRKGDYLVDGDIVFVRSNGNKDLVGRCMLIRNPAFPVTFSGFCIRVRLREQHKYDPVFFTYHFKESGFRRAMAGTAVGANIQNLSQGRLNKYVLSVPDYKMQIRIADTLSKYDSLIENNQKQIKLLEEAAQRLYKEWFVDLRMPKSLNDINQWRKGRFKDLIKLKSGYAFKSNDFITNGKYKIVTIKNVHDGFFDSEKTDSIANVPRSMPAHCFLHDKDILISLTGNVGRVCLVVGDNYLLNQRVAKIESKYPAFAYFFLRSNKMFVKMNNMANGAAQQNLSPIRLENSEIVIPDYQAISLFNQQAQKIINQIVLSIRKIEYLKEARNRLLPKLMNGEIEL